MREDPVQEARVLCVRMLRPLSLRGGQQGQGQKSDERMGQMGQPGVSPHLRSITQACSSPQPNVFTVPTGADLPLLWCFQLTLKLAFPGEKASRHRLFAIHPPEIWLSGCLNTKRARSVETLTLSVISELECQALRPVFKTVTNQKNRQPPVCRGEFSPTA